MRSSQPGGRVQVADLRIHPVKSLAATPLARAVVEPWGLAGDRRWLVTDPTGRFITQRTHPRMALIRAEIVPSGLVLSSPDTGRIEVPTPPEGAATTTITIWRDQVIAAIAEPRAAAWLGAALDTPCQLVHLSDPHARPIDPRFARAGETVSFADGYPLLLTSLGSLAALNGWLGSPIPITRFRPNLVVTGAPAWAEDGWRRIRIGGVVFRVAKPCDRCLVTTIDPETGLRPNPQEPVRTLARYRRDASGGVMFGQNLVPETTGEIAVGDAVDVLEAGAPNVRVAYEEEKGLLF